MVAIAVRGFQGVARTSLFSDPPLASKNCPQGQGRAPPPAPAGRTRAPPPPRPPGGGASAGHWVWSTDPPVSSGHWMFQKRASLGLACYLGAPVWMQCSLSGRHLSTFSGSRPRHYQGSWSHPAARLAEPLNHCLLVGCPPKPSFRGLARQSRVSRLGATPTASGLSFQVPPLQRAV